MSVVVFHKTTGIPMNPEPLWCFFLMTLIIGILSVEVGYRIGKSRHAFSTACCAAFLSTSGSRCSVSTCWVTNGLRAKPVLGIF